MKVLHIQLGQAVRFVQITGLQGKLYGPNLARPFEQKYGFLQGPTSVEQWDLTKGVSFLHGFFEGTVIDRFSLFADGFVCETKADTDIADRFIDDAVAWARDTAGFSIPDISSVARAYISRMNVQMDVALDKAIDGFDEFGRKLAEMVQSYGRHRPPTPYGVATMAFHVDNGTQTSLGAPPFLFERTVNQPYPSGQYFSSAPLRTTDHRLLLEVLEAVLTRN